jgi:predicted RNase H-like nuclease
MEELGFDLKWSSTLTIAGLVAVLGAQATVAYLISDSAVRRRVESLDSMMEVLKKEADHDC